MAMDVQLLIANGMQIRTFAFQLFALESLRTRSLLLLVLIDISIVSLYAPAQSNSLVLHVDNKL